MVDPSPHTRRRAFDPEAPILILSPHFDDAVFTHWSLLADRSLDVTVVNVFGGVPGPGVRAVGDPLPGVRDSAAYVTMRRAEDADALRLVGRQAHNLDFLDFPYRVGQVRIPGWIARAAGRPGTTLVNPPWRRDQPGIHDEIIAQIDRVASAWSMICAPAGIGGHPDHHVVREVALRLGRQRGIPTRLYAEVPYACADGWPAWTKQSAPADADAAIEREWTRTAYKTPCAALPPWRDARVVRLDPDAIDAKRRAVSAYATQFDELNRHFKGRMAHRETWGTEAFWCVPSS